jgi:hypothetical protein
VKYSALNSSHDPQNPVWIPGVQDIIEILLSYMSGSQSVLCGNVQRLARALGPLVLLRRPRPSTSTQDPVWTLNKTGIVKARWLEYSESNWQNITALIDMQNSAVICVLPLHVVVLFGFIQSSDGKFRHLICGRPSGGQSPCGIVPWTIEDKIPENLCWPTVLYSSLSDYDNDTCFVNKHLLGNNLRFALVEQNSSSCPITQNLAIWTDDSDVEWWLKESKNQKM